MALAVVAEETIESLVDGITLRAWTAQTPFAESPGSVPFRLEHFRHGELTFGNRSLPFRFHFAIVTDEGMARMLPRHQHATRRGAHGVARIVAGEAHPGGGQLVKSRRLDFLLSITAQLGVTEVVGQNENHVRLPRQ